MDKQELGKLLNDLARRTAQPVPQSLSEDIKQHIPADLASARNRMDTIKIMIDLRVGKLTAAAAIIIATLLLANFDVLMLLLQPIRFFIQVLALFLQLGS